MFTFSHNDAVHRFQVRFANGFQVSVIVEHRNPTQSVDASHVEVAVFNPQDKMEGEPKRGVTSGEFMDLMLETILR